jgi:acetyl esterase/lipase
VPGGADGLAPVGEAGPTAGAGRTGDRLGEALCAAGVVVLAVRRRVLPRPAALADALAATHWAADHAAELGADPRRLLVGGAGPGAVLAAAVAAHARDEGWPPLAGQVLADPGADEATPGELAGLAPAVVLASPGPAGTAARRHARRLADAGVAVTVVDLGPGVGVATASLRAALAMLAATPAATTTRWEMDA